MQKVTIEGWVARDKDGRLFAYGYMEPEKTETMYFPPTEEQEAILRLDPELFPAVTWESDPVKVTVTVEIASDVNISVEIARDKSPHYYLPPQERS